jgi:hypothetical protein
VIVAELDDAQYRGERHRATASLRRQAWQPPKAGALEGRARVKFFDLPQGTVIEAGPVTFDEAAIFASIHCMGSDVSSHRSCTHFLTSRP